MDLDLEELDEQPASQPTAPTSDSAASAVPSPLACWQTNHGPNFSNLRFCVGIMSRCTCGRAFVC